MQNNANLLTRLKIQLSITLAHVHTILQKLNRRVLVTFTTTSENFKRICAQEAELR